MVWNGSLQKQFEPPHHKAYKMTCVPAKTQISLGIRPVWSESSLCALCVATVPMLLHADSEYSDQTARMRRLICVFVVRICHKQVFSWRGSFIIPRHTKKKTPHKKVAGYYVIPSELWVSVRRPFVRPSVRPSALRFRALTLVPFDLFSWNFA